MSRTFSRTSLTIANGGTLSGELDLTTYTSEKLLAVSIYGPAALTAVVTIRVAPVPGGTYRTLQSGGSDITVGATKAVQLSEINAGALKLLSAGAEGAERIFEVNVSTRE